MNIHTIIIDRVKKEAGSTCEFHNFRFFVFLDEERDRVTGELRDPSVHFPADGVIVSEKYTVYEPGMGYTNITRSPSESECVNECVSECVSECVGMMSVERHGRVTLRQDHLDYLDTHCQFFVCSDFPEIVTLNMMEMKRDNARFFRYYLTGKFDQGYLVYNREMKPLISLE